MDQKYIVLSGQGQGRQSQTPDPYTWSYKLGPDGIAAVNTRLKPQDALEAGENWVLECSGSPYLESAVLRNGIRKITLAPGTRASIVGELNYIRLLEEYQKESSGREK